MSLPNVFTKSETDKLALRINQLNSSSTPTWGTMQVAQMLAHCNVTYEMVYEDIHPKPNFLIKLILKMLVKNTIINEKPYKQNGSTAPQFIIKGNKDFESEKDRLINHISKTQQLGENHFDGLESHSFGKLTKTEWNNLFYKHLDHHLRQFGV